MTIRTRAAAVARELVTLTINEMPWSRDIQDELNDNPELIVPVMEALAALCATMVRVTAEQQHLDPKVAWPNIRAGVG